MNCSQQGLRADALRVFMPSSLPKRGLALALTTLSKTETHVSTSLQSFAGQRNQI